MLNDAPAIARKKSKRNRIKKWKEANEENNRNSGWNWWCRIHFRPINPIDFCLLPLMDPSTLLYLVFFHFQLPSVSSLSKSTLFINRFSPWQDLIATDLFHLFESTSYTIVWLNETLLVENSLSNPHIYRLHIAICYR